VVEDLTDDQLWPVFEGVLLSDLEICTNGDTRSVVRDDVVRESAG